MDETVKEYIDLIDSMLSDPKFENQAYFLTSVKKTILSKSKITPGQINSIERIHAQGR